MWAQPDRPRRTAAAITLGVVLAVASRPSAAAACAACETGDPTLTLAGAEPPMSARLRLSANVRHRADTLGSGANRLRLNEEIVELGASYSPVSSVTVSLLVPFVRRDASWPGVEIDAGVGLGDAEGRARVILWQDRLLAPRHIVSLIGGVRAPTAPELRDDLGARNDAVQPGADAWVPIGGASYTWLAHPWSIYASSVAYVPIDAGGHGESGAPSVRTGVAAQWQSDTLAAARIGVDTRVDAIARGHGGGADPDSGGLVAFLTPAILMSPTTDVVVHVSIAVPVVDALRGAHEEGPVLAAGVAVDL